MNTLRGLYKRIWLVKPVHVDKKSSFFGNAKKAVENSEKRTSLKFLSYLTCEDFWKMF